MMLSNIQKRFIMDIMDMTIQNLQRFLWKEEARFLFFQAKFHLTNSKEQDFTTEGEKKNSRTLSIWLEWKYYQKTGKLPRKERRKDMNSEINSLLYNTENLFRGL